ncbi:hypothetical protein BX600DRAFT_428892 [Xylariales sp. PMI_506]|nr:hypothetical protein BX600DRAFT_428892 [Xylariales sp. PMI_506]
MELCPHSGVLSPPPLRIVKRVQASLFDGKHPQQEFKKDKTHNLVHTHKLSECNFTSSRPGDSAWRGKRANYLLGAFYNWISSPLGYLELLENLIDCSVDEILGNPSSSPILSTSALTDVQTQTPSKSRYSSSFALGGSSPTTECPRNHAEGRMPTVSSNISGSFFNSKTLCEDDRGFHIDSSSSDESFDLRPPVHSRYHELDGYSFPPPHPRPIRLVNEIFKPHIIDPYLLVPHVSITPDANTVGSDPVSFWAAIEISSQLCCPNRANIYNNVDCSRNNQPKFVTVQHCGTSLSKYGYLSNIRVEILPTVKTAIFELMSDATPRLVHSSSFQATKLQIANTDHSIINAGSSHLILAHIRYMGRNPSTRSDCEWSRPENLFADIEYQLGYVTTEFLEVRLSYSHSGFPGISPLSSIENSACRTRLETVVVGEIKLQNPESPWVPREPQASISTTLYRIIASHWGPVQANVIVKRMAAIPERGVGKQGKYRHFPTVDGAIPPDRLPEPTGTAPPFNVPRRQASLNKTDFQKEALGKGPRQTREDWTQIRRTSLSSCPNNTISRGHRYPASSTTPSLCCSVDPPAQEDATTQRN